MTVINKSLNMNNYRKPNLPFCSKSKCKNFVKKLVDRIVLDPRKMNNEVKQVKKLQRAQKAATFSILA